MTPHEFVAKWRHANLSERAAAQSLFIDLCRLLDQPDPISADPAGEWFTFEKGTQKASGGRGWADVWRRGGRWRSALANIRCIVWGLVEMNFRERLLQRVAHLARQLSGE